VWKRAGFRWEGFPVGHSTLPTYNSYMEISLTPEIEERLARIATEAGKAANEVVQELVADYLDHDEWFRREVQKGLASLDRGKFVSHEEVGRRIERILRP
jgi:predicted transcriptional regulator